MDCIIANCRAECLGCCRRWILDPTIELDAHPKSAPIAWISSYLQRPKRSHKAYVAEKLRLMRMTKASA